MADATSQSQGGTLLRRVLGLLGLVAIAGWFIAAAATAHAREVMPYAAISIVIPLLPLVLERKPDPFSPPVYTGIYFFVGMSAVLAHILSVPQLGYREIHLGGARAVEKTIEAYVLLSLSSATYLVGYYASRSGIGRWFLPNVAGLRWDGRRLLVVSLALGLIFTGCYAYFQSRIGTGILELSLAEGKAVWREDPTLSWMMRGIGLGQVPLLVYGAAVMRPGNSRKVVVVIALSLVMAFLTMRTGGRGLAILLLIALGVVFHFLYRRIPGWLIAVVIAGTLMGSNALGQLRLGGADAVERTPAAMQPGEILMAHEDDRQRLLPMVTIMHFFPEKRDFLLGETWAGIIAAPIPRWLWPGKVEAFRMRDTQIIMELAGAPTPCPLPFLLFANFGWPGVALGMTLWGAFHRALARWREASAGDPGTTLLYAMILIHVGPTLLQLSATMQWVIPCWLVIIFVGQRARARALVAAPLPGVS